MVVQDSSKNQLKIEIPLADIDELGKYQSALLSILHKIDIEPDDQELIENLKTIYTLLSHTLIKNELLLNYVKHKH